MNRQKFLGVDKRKRGDKNITSFDIFVASPDDYICESHSEFYSLARYEFQLVKCIIGFRFEALNKTMSQKEELLAKWSPIISMN